MGQGASLRAAWEKAFATDRQAPFGGIIAVNQRLDAACAEAIAEIFSEVIVAPASHGRGAGDPAEEEEPAPDADLAGPRQAAGRGRRSVGADSFLWQQRDQTRLPPPS